MKDLIILVADLDTENVLEGLLPRLEHVYGTRTFTYDIKRHPYRDPGCRTGSAGFLRSFAGQYHHALVVFDKEGSGMENSKREELEEAVELDLTNNGWANDDIAVIVIDPEVENWIWVNSPRVSNALNWKETQPLFEWLHEKGWLNEETGKPLRPKEAMETILRKVKKPRSAAIYRNIAGRTSFARCQDRSFIKMTETLKKWFLPASQ